MECIMEDASTVHTVGPVKLDEADQRVRGRDAEYTPGDFFLQFGTVIAICLGLAMLAELLVYIVG
jgi:hypothetical protein